MADDEDEDELVGAYEDGHWVWDDAMKGLLFVRLMCCLLYTPLQCNSPVMWLTGWLRATQLCFGLGTDFKLISSDRPPVVLETVAITAIVPTGAVSFRDDIDLLEQLRFRKRYARKLEPGQADVITLQDVKDLAIFTAPVAILSPMLINLLHLPTTERLLRALILYCQYYLQIADEMKKRIKELDTKVRIPICDIVEAEFSENLCDLRALVAKEYSILLIGGSETNKFHHMGPQKKRKSLSARDARLIETLLRMSIQIVWLALQRRCYNTIELEINRLFKSEIFNSVEHMLHTNYIAEMSKEEYKVLLGGCVRHDQKLNTCSPLMNEAFCHRVIDYRMMGLGVTKYKSLPPRLEYMLTALAAEEEVLIGLGISCGILGLPRSLFDTMLRALPTIMDYKKSQSSIGSSQSTKSKKSMFKSTTSAAARSSTKSTTKTRTKAEATYVYNDIKLPEKEKDESPLPIAFPDQLMDIKPCNEVQRKRWQLRLYRLMHPSSSSKRKIHAQRRRSNAGW